MESSLRYLVNTSEKRPSLPHRSLHAYGSFARGFRRFSDGLILNPSLCSSICEPRYARHSRNSIPYEFEERVSRGTRLFSGAVPWCSFLLRPSLFYRSILVTRSRADGVLIYPRGLRFGTQ